MGGVDGKNWGVYVANGGPNCEWSIRSVARYRPREILDRGTAPCVDIERDGDVDTWSGPIDNDHRIVVLTNGCSAWRLTRWAHLAPTGHAQARCGATWKIRVDCLWIMTNIHDS